MALGSRAHLKWPIFNDPGNIGEVNAALNITPSDSLPTVAPIPAVPTDMPKNLTDCWALIKKLRGDVQELSNRIRAMAANGATGQQLQQRDQLNNALKAQVAKLQKDNATLTTTIRTYNQEPPPGQAPTGLQAAYKQLITKTQQAQADAAQARAQLAART